MIFDCTVIIDIGKTNAKASLWDGSGRLITKRARANAAPPVTSYRSLDIDGIEAWLFETLSEFARLGTVSRIMPVGHGAAAAVIQNGRLWCSPMDYEDEPTAQEKEAYASQRDSFLHTGSPLLPCCLNFGMQLHRLETILGPFPDDALIVPWPQYWAWRLCGIPASEVSSLGCHTDLWQPLNRRFSDLALRRGWSARMAPVRHAGDCLSTVTTETIHRTGLPANCSVLCGMHDSNAALVAARGHREISEGDATVLSTGTWFVAMRSSQGRGVDPSQLREARDCLINVDVQGCPVPSGRFMGGREVELLGGVDSFALARDYDPDTLIDRLPALMASGAIAYPTFVPGVGPFPTAVGEWERKPEGARDQRAIAGLYLALMADSTLNLIGSQESLLIEGRFAEEIIFVRALAALRPTQRVYVSNAHQDVACGALRLIDPALAPPSGLKRIQPLGVDLGEFASRWQARAMRSAGAT